MILHTIRGIYTAGPFKSNLTVLCPNFCLYTLIVLHDSYIPILPTENVRISNPMKCSQCELGRQPLHMRGFLDVKRLCHNIHIVNFLYPLVSFNQTCLIKYLLHFVQKHSTPHTHTNGYMTLIPPGEEASGGGDKSDTNGEKPYHPIYFNLYIIQQ